MEEVDRKRFDDDDVNFSALSERRTDCFSLRDVSMFWSTPLVRPSTLEIVKGMIVGSLYLIC